MSHSHAPICMVKPKSAKYFKITLLLQQIHTPKNIISLSPHSTQARLVFMCIASPIVAVSAIKLALEYHTSGNLVFRTVGADPTMQSMCRKLQRAIVLIMFDAQALVRLK